ncbi:MAG: D-sedoheptulose-7-phosphate isomerase [Thermoplasmata archaeon]
MARSPQEYTERYVQQTVHTVQASYLAEGIATLVEVFSKARAAGKTLYFFGNGGSASTSSHMANDLAKLTIVGNNRRFRCVSLSDPIPTMLAWANDLSYAEIFSEQIKNLGTPGDVALGISGSGNSPNVLRGLEEARKFGMVTVGLIGTGGGKMKTLCDHSIVVPSNDMQHIEDAHLVVCHLLCAYFRDERPT